MRFTWRKRTTVTIRRARKWPWLDTPRVEYIAYDTLNRLIADDALASDASGILRRTGLFLTFGSPLDKIAFFFSVMGKNTQHIREQLAAVVQPLIQDYRNRAFRWVNVYSRNDIICGSLDFYDLPGTSAPLGVENVRDEHALIPSGRARRILEKPHCVERASGRRLHADCFGLRTFLQSLRQLVSSGYNAEGDADPVPAVDGHDGERKVGSSACSLKWRRVSSYTESGTCPSRTLVTASAQARAARSRSV